MKLQTISLIALICLGAVATASEKLHGKTEAQVLAMGQDKWLEYAGNKPGGSSTAGMVEAEDFYARAAEKRNHKLESGLSKSLRSKFEKLDKALSDAGDALLDAEYQATGRGSMFRPMFVGRKADIEDLMYGLLRHKKLPMDAPLMGIHELEGNWKEYIEKQVSDDLKPEEIKALAAKGLEEERKALDATQEFDDPIQLPARKLVASWLATDRR